MIKLRLRFTKNGRAVYISQLDLMRTLQRSFQRAGYPLKYSEGYNPHPLLSVALPMSVGISSICEILDFKMDDYQDDLLLMKEKLSESLPEGLDVIEVYHPDTKITELKWLKISGTLIYDEGTKINNAVSIQNFFIQDTIEVMKKSKRGETLFDCGPHIKDFSTDIIDNNSIMISGFISAQNPTINPNLLLKAMPHSLKPDFARFNRVETYHADMSIFR